jgi:hypothetical protein
LQPLVEHLFLLFLKKKKKNKKERKRKEKKKKRLLGKSKRREAQRWMSLKVKTNLKEKKNFKTFFYVT